MARLNAVFSFIYKTFSYFGDSIRSKKGSSGMRNGRLEKMALKDLIALEAKIKAAIEAKRVSERADLRAAMEDMARKSGFSVQELFGGRGGKRGKVAPKYRNPKDPMQTWTGRGRRPTWMVEAGGNPERFLIK
jgi:DNA-binding protein H-NS